MRNRFDQQLEELNRELIEMGAMCEDAINLTIDALDTEDTVIARKVIAVDSEIDQMERSIETMCLKLLLQQQPVASDLRQISAALKMITDMERIGDQAADIAEITTYLPAGAIDRCENISLMAKGAISMVTKSVDAFVKRDVNLAREAMADDDIVDDYFDSIKNQLIKDISEDPTEGEFALDLLMIAKYYERIGDHAVNIAEWVEFSVTGVHKGEDGNGKGDSIRNGNVEEIK